MQFRLQRPANQERLWSTKTAFPGDLFPQVQVNERYFKARFLSAVQGVVWWMTDGSIVPLFVASAIDSRKNKQRKLIS
jgi:hypothetical protein